MKKTKLSKTPYPGLDKSVNLRIRHELMDQDYISKLSENEKRWLSDFMREWSSADFTHKGKKFHRSKKSRKAIYDANNARNRDAFAVTKSNDMLKGMTGSELGRENPGHNIKQSRNPGMSGSKSTVPNELEDTIIAVLDFFNETKGLKKTD